MNSTCGKTNLDAIGKWVLSILFINGRSLLFVAFILLVIIYPKNSSAHEENQPPFLKIANQFTDHYKIRTLSVKDFILPQDSINKLFLVEEEIPFTIDVFKITIPKDLKYDENIIWDFGDGSTDMGFVATHRYKKPGSYLVSIKSRYAENEKPVLIESLFINVVPFKNYKLPTTQVLVNGEKIKDGAEISLDFSKPISLSADVSQGLHPLKFYWDLGDGKTADGKKINNVYQASHYFVKPTVRISDANGLISDFSVKINNAKYSEQEKQKKDKLNTINKFVYLIPVLLILIGIFYGIKKSIDK